jgi:hypothetical protein
MDSQQAIDDPRKLYGRMTAAAMRGWKSALCVVALITIIISIYAFVRYEQSSAFSEKYMRSGASIADVEMAIIRRLPHNQRPETLDVDHPVVFDWCSVGNFYTPVLKIVLEDIDSQLENIFEEEDEILYQEAGAENVATASVGLQAKSARLKKAVEILDTQNSYCESANKKIVELVRSAHINGQSVPAVPKKLRKQKTLATKTAETALVSVLDLLWPDAPSLNPSQYSAAGDTGSKTPAGDVSEGAVDASEISSNADLSSKNIKLDKLEQINVDVGVITDDSESSATASHHVPHHGEHQNLVLNDTAEYDANNITCLDTNDESTNRTDSIILEETYMLADTFMLAVVSIFAWALSRCSRGNTDTKTDTDECSLSPLATDEWTTTVGQKASTVTWLNLMFMLITLLCHFASILDANQEVITDDTLAWILIVSWFAHRHCILCVHDGVLSHHFSMTRLPTP